MSAREACFEDQLDLEPEQLVFIDKTWTATNMTRSHGRCRRGERLRMGLSHGHRKTTTLIAGLGATGMVARWCWSLPDGALTLVVRVEKQAPPVERVQDGLLL